MERRTNASSAGGCSGAGASGAGAAGGDSLLIIGKLLGHKNASSASRYAHLGDDPLKAAADRISRQIDAAMNGEQGEVVELPRKA